MERAAPAVESRASAAERTRALLACPRCRIPLGDSGCAACGVAFELDGSIRDFLAGAELPGRGRDVQAFYEKRPFPGYAAGDGSHTIVDRGRRSPFLAAVDAALPADATVLDCGSGTAQVSAFLALSSVRRVLIAADGCRASLREADRFRTRAAIENLALVRANLFELPLVERAFDFVICRGVVHHTEDPREATARVARHVAPGGYLLLGIYESLARLPHCARRALGRATGRPISALDPILRQRDLDPEKKRTWIEDQYLHPLEHLLSASRVARELEALGFEWVRSVPPVTSEMRLFEPTPRPRGAAFLARRLGWLAAGFNDEDAGLVCLVVRRHRRA
jgi:SAM-dependent methyltransferase